MSAKIEAACAKIRATRMRVTKQRLALLSLIAKAPAPVSVPEAAELVNDTDTVTIYRSLHALSELGILRSHRGGKGEHFRFTWSDGEQLPISEKVTFRTEAKSYSGGWCWFGSYDDYQTEKEAVQEARTHAKWDQCETRVVRIVESRAVYWSSGAMVAAREGKRKKQIK